MKSITFNRNSLHYRLATVYGSYDGSWDCDKNFCTYSKSVFRGFLLTLVIVIAGVMLLAPQINMLIWLAVRLPSQKLIPPDEINSFIIGATFIAIEIVGGLLVLKFKLGDSKTYISNIIPTTPSFIKTWYQSFKDKTCVKIDFN